MTDRQDKELLALAAYALTQELRPALSGREKYLAAMAARAIDLAQKLAEADGEFSAIEREGFARLYGEPADGDLDSWRRRAIADLRAGAIAPGSRQDTILRDFLLEITARRLRLVNLHYLSGRRRGAESAV